MRKAHPKAIVDAIFSGDYNEVEKYVNEDNVNMVDKHGDSLLSLAVTATYINMNIIRLLIKRGADVNIRLGENWSLLHSAANSLQKELILVLLKAGCDPNATNDAGQTPLTTALCAPDPKDTVIKFLLEHGADPNRKEKSSASALEIASKAGRLDLLATKKSN
jgi:uncharacterized protein